MKKDLQFFSYALVSIGLIIYLLYLTFFWQNFDRKVFNTKEGLKTVEVSNVQCFYGYGDFEVIITSESPFKVEKESVAHESLDNQIGFHSLTLPANGTSCFIPNITEASFTVKANESKSEEVMLEVLYINYSLFFFRSFILLLIAILFIIST